MAIILIQQSNFNRSYYLKLNKCTYRPIWSEFSDDPYIERFNRSYRNEVLDCYLFNNLNEVRQLTDEWIEVYNHERPHDSLNDMTPAEFKQMA